MVNFTKKTIGHFCQKQREMSLQRFVQIKLSIDQKTKYLEKEAENGNN